MLSLWSKLCSLCLGLLQQPPNQSPSLCSCLHRLSPEPTEMLLNINHIIPSSLFKTLPHHIEEEKSKDLAVASNLSLIWPMLGSDLSHSLHFGYSFYSASNTEAHTYLEAFVVAVHSVWNAFPPELLQNLLPLFIQVSA